uniref:Uncharacterized protein n=1 Tax=Acrobeloides nanus TaxID=290746 RepID=A0A914ECU8_9BILA
MTTTTTLGPTTHLVKSISVLPGGAHARESVISPRALAFIGPRRVARHQHKLFHGSQQATSICHSDQIIKTSVLVPQSCHQQLRDSPPLNFRLFLHHCHLLNCDTTLDNWWKKSDGWICFVLTSRQAMMDRECSVRLGPTFLLMGLIYFR